LISVEQASQIIRETMLSFSRRMADGLVELGQRSNALTAEDLIADRDYPPFHRSMMDGIAVSLSAIEQGQTEFQIAGTCAAGQPQGLLLDQQTCLEIMTGAPLPHGADLVIPYEDLKVENGFAKVCLVQTRKRFENVHLKGSDCHHGDIVLAKGASLNGPRWGIAASIGKTHVKTNRQLRINVISTGDELVSVAETPLAHQIRRSNAHAIQASLQDHGYTDVVLNHLNDDVDAIKAHYQENAKAFDVLIYSGGVSKGKFDHLPSTWKTLGVTELLHGVSQRPGKPLWYGIDQINQTIVLGLPGNPVSSLVCLHRYFLNSKPLYTQLGDDFSFEKKLTCFLPVKIESAVDGVLKAYPLKIKNSGEFTALALSDGFVELPKDRAQFNKGEAFLFYSWSGL
jgi:molybdopterin molybdotransferase